MYTLAQRALNRKLSLEIMQQTKKFTEHFSSRFDSNRVANATNQRLITDICINPLDRQECTRFPINYRH